MSRLRGLAEKELAELVNEKDLTIKAIEHTKQALVNRQLNLKEVEKHIEELELFLKPKKPTKRNK